MGHTDTERSNGNTPPVTMPVILNQRMAMQVHVLGTVMVVRMHMPAFPDQSHRKHPAEEHEHHADTKLGRQREGFRDRYAKHQDHRPGQEQDEGVPKPPTESNHARGAERWPLRQHRGYGSQMVRVQGMAKPQHQSES